MKNNILLKIWEWCKDEDWIVIAIPASILTILLAIYKLWFWHILCIIIGITVVGFEIMALKYTGLSISDQFRTWKKEHKTASIIILITVFIVFLSIIFHLLVNI